VGVKLADAERRPLSVPSYCVFCEIIADRAPARVRYLDEDIIVIVNTLTWVPLMLLVIPKKHMGQMEMWCSDLMPRLGDVAVEMGCTYAPNGFRILSNFGRDGMQSQGHSHIHVIGGTNLGPYA
jgi:histidine triad (HIT) family protein